MLGAVDDVLAHTAFPSEHGCPPRSTTHWVTSKELKRWADVVGLFPNWQTVIRRIMAVLAEQDDERVTGRRYFSLEQAAKLQLTHAPASELALLAAD